jgi:hypothetical protein
MIPESRGIVQFECAIVNKACYDIVTFMFLGVNYNEIKMGLTLVNYVD